MKSLKKPKERSGEQPLYLSKAAKDMLLQIGNNGELYYKLLTTRELFALLELSRKGLIEKAPNTEYQSGEGNKERSNGNAKAVYAELCLRFIPYFLALFLFILAMFFCSFSFYDFLGNLPLL